jgi:predicted signal transduction protein with EAL and GGDEF domain
VAVSIKSRLEINGTFFTGLFIDRFFHSILFYFGTYITTVIISEEFGLLLVVLTRPRWVNRMIRCKRSHSQFPSETCKIDGQALQVKNRDAVTRLPERKNKNLFYASQAHPCESNSSSHGRV